LRDFDAGTAELFFATPMSLSAYLGGRFAAGYLAAVVVLVAVALGVLTGGFMPWADPARLGPTELGAYVYAFAVFVLPGLFFMSAFLFLLASLTRSMLTTYIGVFAFFVLRLIAQLAASNLEHHTLGALIDPFGLGAFRLATQYWSAEERNTRLPEVVGTLLANRVIWIAISAAMLATTLALFRPDREGLRLWKRRGKLADTALAPVAAAIALPSATLRTNAGARWTQLLKLARFDTRGVLGGVAFLVMLAFGMINLGANLALSNRLFDTKLYPVTHVMTEAIGGSFRWLLWIIIAFYAGELVWRERSGRINEVTDAFPLPDWIPLLSKLIAIAAVIVGFQLAGCIECVVYQLSRGYSHIEPELYLSNIAMSSLQFLLVAALALFLQVVANNKFLGYLFIVLFYVSAFTLDLLHFEHNLYNYASAPGVPYSDMNGYGHFLPAFLWFNAYWTCLATALLVVAALLWPRGTAQAWSERAAVARHRFRAPSRTLLVASLLAFAGTGGWIFYNTNVINDYIPGDVAMKQRADYEKRYRKYLDLPQPKITDVKVDMDIYPHDRRVDLRGHYVLRNKTGAPISDLHVLIPVDSMKVQSLTFAPHTVVSDDREDGYTIYRLKQPLQPGESMDFDFVLQYWSRGFRNSPDDTHVVDNGTFINSFAFPHFGYTDQNELTDRNVRRKYGLGPAHRLPKIDDVAARQMNLTGRDGDWVTFETTVSTVPDQIALAPGYLEKEWTANGRRYFHYRMDKPILDFVSFQSARYAVRKETWNGVNLEVYYDPQHAYNVDRMLYAARTSMAHFDKAFGPYQFRQFRILEFPGYERFAESFANTVPFSESIGFIADLRDPDDIDYVFYVTAHELAHQWWAHQVIGAYAQGVTMLDETFAQYSALMVQEHEYGTPKMRKFLKYELDRYLSGRGGELVEELPLALNENQDYIHYRKGSVVMYSLKDYLGEDVVDRTLARFDREWAFKGPPYPTTKDFLADLRAESDPKWSSLITDLFDRITIFDDRVTEATSKKRADGKFDVTLKLHAVKVYVDGVGKETKATIDMPIDIGVFARSPTGKEQDEKVLYLARRVVADGDSTVTITVDSEPYEAGIDPYNKLVDRVSDDNRKRVEAQ
jgi:hypothetical protein